MPAVQLVTRWLVDALAVWRLTRLLTIDGLTVELRELVTEWTESGPRSVAKEKLAELIGCPHCVSVWAALGVVYVARRSPWWPLMADALALAAVSSLIADGRDALSL